MKPNANYFKWTVILIIAVLLFLFLKKCNCNGTGKRTPDTISVRIDTVTTYVKADTVYVPELVGVSNTIYKYKPVYKTDTLEISVVLPTDTAAILKRFYEKAFYRDKQNVAGGTVTIEDTVTQNRITSRRLIANIPSTTITKTVTVAAPKRVVGYFSLSYQGNARTPYGGAGLGFGLKAKNDVIYNAEWKVFSGSNYPMIEGRVLLPLRLSKHR